MKKPRLIQRYRLEDWLDKQRELRLQRKAAKYAAQQQRRTRERANPRQRGSKGSRRDPRTC